MREPHEIEERISAHLRVIAVIAEGLHDYELMLEEHLRIPLERMTDFDHQRIRQIKLTMQILYKNRDWNEGMIESLKDDLDKALDKETRGW